MIHICIWNLKIVIEISQKLYFIEYINISKNRIKVKNNRMDDFLLDRRNLELVLDNLRDGIIAHDTKRKIIFFNRAAEKITGYSKLEVVGQDCHDVFGSPLDRKSVV